MKLSITDFRDLIFIKHEVFIDERGFFKETFKKQALEDLLGYRVNFCQENQVQSFKNSLRGLHFQTAPHQQAKLISISIGKILDVVVDLRKESSTYGKYFACYLSDSDHMSLFIPRGFAHGYLTLSEKAIVNYKVDNYYCKDAEGGISFNDKKLNINWNIEFDKMLISEKDLNHKKYNW